MPRHHLTAADLMTRDVATIAPTARIPDIAARLLEIRVSALPVVDDAGHLLGLVSEADLLRRVENDTDVHRWWLDMLVTADVRATEFLKAHGHTAADVMTRHVVGVAETATLREIVDTLEANRVRRAPVLRDGKLVGIISRSDVLRSLLENHQAAAMPPGDHALRANILAAILAEPWADLVSVNVTVRDGAVELTGVIDSEAKRAALCAVVEAVPGVARVGDRLRIGTPPRAPAD